MKIDICATSCLASERGEGLMEALTKLFVEYDRGLQGGHGVESWARERAKSCIERRCKSCKEPCVLGKRALEEL